MCLARASLVAVFFGMLVSSNAAAQDADVEVAGWLAGCWIDSSSSEALVEEQWMAPRGGLMVGMVRNVRGGIATGHEFLLIHRTGGNLVLSAYPSGQQPTDFLATVATPQELRFENPSHDFPQKIVYRHGTANGIVASVFGAVDAVRPAFELHYERVACHGVNERH
jgi:hypothetical protein